MKLAYAFLADAAEINPVGGRFFVFNGGLEVVQCREFPAVIPSLAVVAKFRILDHERQTEHAAVLQGERPNGEVLFDELPILVPMVPPNHPADRPAYHTLVAMLHGVPIREQGRHHLCFRVGEHELGSLNFYADLIPQ